MHNLITRMVTLCGAALIGATLSAAGVAQKDFRLMSVEDARQALAGIYQTTTPATMYIWSDKYVYRANEEVTVRWTINPNGDFYPYTIFAYRINNQTGAKTFLPGPGVTDVFGNTAEQGFQPTQLPTASKAVLAGEGGRFPAVTVPNELGMHTIVVELRDYLGGTVIKSAYAKVGVVEREEFIESNITSNRTLTNNVLWRLRGNVFVQNGATLTVDPGTFIMGEPGSAPTSYLTVTNNSKFVANGTKSRPVIMTSSRPFGQRARGDWGGLVLLGQAPINLAGGSALAEGQVNDDRVRYGGTDAEHSCGTLRYLRVEFAGARFSQTNELNGIAFHGCGRGTVVDHIQSHYNADDAVEFFGGTNDAKYIVASYVGDDLIDWTYGYSGRIQYAVAINGADPGGNGIEADNNDQSLAATPTSTPTLYNFTLIGGAKDDSARGARLRAGTAGSLNNFVFQGWPDEGLRIETSESLAHVDAGTLNGNGILLWNNRGGQKTLADQTDATTLPILQGTRGQFRNVVVADPKLLDVTTLSDPNFLPAVDSPVRRAGWIQPPDNGFFDQTASFMGAFLEINWTEEWTTFLQEHDIRQ